MEAVGNGFAIAATAIATVACAPASAFVGVSFVGMYIAGVAAGCYLSYGLIIK